MDFIPQKRSATCGDLWRFRRSSITCWYWELNSCLITEFLTCIIVSCIAGLSNLKWEPLKHLNFLDLADRSGSLLFLACGRGHRRDLEYQWPGQSPTTSPGSQGLDDHRNVWEGTLGTQARNLQPFMALWVFVFVSVQFVKVQGWHSIKLEIVEVLLEGFLKFNPLTWNAWAQDPHTQNRITLRRLFCHRLFPQNIPLRSSIPGEHAKKLFCFAALKNHGSKIHWFWDKYLWVLLQL